MAGALKRVLSLTDFIVRVCLCLNSSETAIFLVRFRIISMDMVRSKHNKINIYIR